MSVTQNLISGETIVFESKKHWFAPIRASLVAGLMVIGAWLLWLIAPAGGEGLFGSIGGALGHPDGHRGPRPGGGRGRLDHLQHRGLADRGVRRHQRARPARGRARVQAELHDPAVVAERRANESRLPRWPARLRGRHPVDDVRPGRRRPLPRDHEARRVPRRGHEPEDGGRWRRGPGATSRSPDGGPGARRPPLRRRPRRPR